MTHPIVLVTWLDATHTDEPVHETDIIGVMRHTVGYLVADRSEGLVLACDLSLDEGVETFQMGFTIPQEYVRSIIRLRKEGRRVHDTPGNPASRGA